MGDQKYPPASYPPLPEIGMGMQPPIATAPPPQLQLDAAVLPPGKNQGLFFMSKVFFFPGFRETRVLSQPKHVQESDALVPT